MDKGKRAKVDEEEGSELDPELVMAIEKLQEVQDELERVSFRATSRCRPSCEQWGRGADRSAPCLVCPMRLLLSVGCCCLVICRLHISNVSSSCWCTLFTSHGRI